MGNTNTTTLKKRRDQEITSVGRRRADSNRWCSFCRAVPYHLATSPEKPMSNGERETGIEPATFSLARRCSTTESLPLTLPCFRNCKISYLRRFVNKVLTKNLLLE